MSQDKALCRRTGDFRTRTTMIKMRN